jgi:hypothetical protein
MSQLASLIVTDAALRFLTGGGRISQSTLTKFRRENATLFSSVLNQTIASGLQEGWVDPQQLAVDGMRLRAHASTKAIRTLERSTKRLAQLAQVDTSTLDPQQAAAHTARVAKHEEAVRLCTEQQRTSVCLTNPTCSLMKFPNGASAPGHRVLATVAGQRERLVVGLIVNDAPTDYGQLQVAIEDARARLTTGGLAQDEPLRCAADAGFLGEDDQRFIIEHRTTIDVIVPPPTEGQRHNDKIPMFKRSDFPRDESGRIRCPAGKLMKPPADTTKRRQVWVGDGCNTCPK